MPRDSIKNKPVDHLDLGAITEDDAWIQYAVNAKNEPHSYREVIDSGLFHIGFLAENGGLNDLGYKFVDAFVMLRMTMLVMEPGGACL